MHNQKATRPWTFIKNEEKRLKIYHDWLPLTSASGSHDIDGGDTIDEHAAVDLLVNRTPSYGIIERSDSSGANEDLLENQIPAFEVRKKSASPRIPAHEHGPTMETLPPANTVAVASEQPRPPPSSRYAYLLRRRERAGARNVQAELWQISRDGPEQIPLSSRLHFTPLDEIDDYRNNESVNVVATVASVEGLIQPMNCPFWPIAITDSPGVTRTLRVFSRHGVRVDLGAALQALEPDDVIIVLQASVYNGSLSAFDQTSILIAKDRESACDVVAAVEDRDCDHYLNASAFDAVVE